MSKRVIIVVFFFALMCLSAFRSSQSQRFVLSIKCDYLTVDNINNLYVAKGIELIKYTPSGKLFARYSDLKLGNISFVDATNPLKILLYYKDYQQIVFLDNQLSVNSQNVSLEKLGYEQCELACAGANNSFWIYDKQNNELIRFNENSKKIAATGNLKQVLKSDLSPNYILEHNGFLFLNCPETGIYVFDMFGTFSKLISLKNLSSMQVNEHILYFKKDSMLCSYNYKLFEELCMPIKETQGYHQIVFKNKTTYLAYADSVVKITN